MAGRGDEKREWLDLAKRAARKAGVIQAENLGRLSGYELKGVANIVTEVDLLCEKAVLDLIRREAPEHAIMSEEQGGLRRAPFGPEPPFGAEPQGRGQGRSQGRGQPSGAGLSSEYIWVVDPLDGTTNYAHSYVKFCTSIALVKRGRPVVGVIYDQMANEMFYSIAGQGAFLNGDRIKVSGVKKLDDSLLLTGFSYDRGKKLCDNLDIFQKVIPHPHSIRVDGSAALDLCYVASGRCDGFWERNLNPWDVAAGGLVVEEAGGKVTDFSGQPMALDRKELFASNGKIHKEFLEIITRTKEGCHEG